MGALTISTCGKCWTARQDRLITMCKRQHNRSGLDCINNSARKHEWPRIDCKEAAFTHVSRGHDSQDSRLDGSVFFYFFKKSFSSQRFSIFFYYRQHAQHWNGKIEHQDWNRLWFGCGVGNLAAVALLYQTQSL